MARAIRSASLRIASSAGVEGVTSSERIEAACLMVSALSIALSKSMVSS
jgi:hypothetical protein